MVRRSAPGDKFTSVTAGPTIPDSLVFHMSAMQSLTGVSLSNSQAASVVKAIQSTLARFGARTIAFDVLASAAPVVLVARNL